MLLDFNIFYRTFGLRRVEQLLTPRFGAMEHFQLPKRSITHIAHGNAAKYGPTEQEVSLQGFSAAIVKEGRILTKAIARPILIHHVLNMTQGALGNPTRLSVQPTAMIRQYHQHYRRFRTAPDLGRVITDTNSLLVFNYDMLPHLTRYPRGPFSHFFEWYNIERTMWTEIAKTAAISDRPQFVVRHIPQVIPPRSSLQLFEQMKSSAPSNRMLQVFDTPERLFLAEVWKWFGLHRSSSMLSMIPRQYLSRVNLVFIESGKWTTINLGTLDSWRKPMEEELFPNETVKTNLIDPVRYQNRILRFFMSIMQLRTMSAPEVTDLANQVLDADDASYLRKETTITKVTKVGAGAAQVDPLTGQAKIKTEIIRTHLNDVLDDKPDDTSSTVIVDDDLDIAIDKDLSELEKLREATPDDETLPDEVKKESFITTPQIVVAKVPKMERLPHDEALIKIANRYLNSGSLSAAQYRHYESLASQYKQINSPESTMKLDEFIAIPPEMLKIEKSMTIADITTVPDKTMLSSSLLDFDKRYTQNVMQRDIAGMVMCYAQAGYAVTSYEVEEIESLMGSYKMYTARVMPIDGIASTIRFKLPTIDPDGSYMSNGVKYNLRKQRTEIPICKTAPDTVALTSYYGKAFVRRSDKRVNNYAMWLINNIMAKMLDNTDDIITNGHPGDMSDNHFKGPRLYTVLASGFNSFTLKLAVYPRSLGQLSFNLLFDHTKREERFGKDTLAQFEHDGAVVAGKTFSGSHWMVINKDSTVTVYGTHASPAFGSDSMKFDLGPFAPWVGLDGSKSPVDIAVMKVSGATLPLGIILAYEMGLEPMLALLKSKVRRVPAGTRLNMHNDEEAVVFNNESIIFSKTDHLTGMFLGGFGEYHRHIRRFNSHLFNSKEVYLNVLESAGLGVRYIREMDLFYQMFIDPITHDLLVEMKEPTEMRALLVRAGSMLINDDHPDELDGSMLRLRGYERMAGAVYSEMVRSIRQHNGNAGKSRSPLNMDPFAVFTNIQTDPSKTQVVDINPIQNLKEQEAVTYSGVGGRNSRTMTKKTRTYHENDMGTISSDTVDSSDVAINTFTSADPQFTSLRGLSRAYNVEMGITALLSTSALLSPGSDRDDPKRVNFIGIQHSHGVACNGYHQMPVRTGYEQIIAHRTSDMYAATASQDGKVIQATPTGIIVEFADGTKQGYEIGRRFGNAAGLTIPHEIIANAKLGQQFKKGHVLIYNTGFFEPDILNPNNVVWKAGLLIKTALMEIPETLEDSSAISTRIADRLKTKISKFIDVVVSFDQAVNKLIKVGQLVTSEDILCIIEDAVTSRAELFDAESLDTLKNLSNLAPQAKVKGVVERIEVYYHGDKEDMSESLVAIVNASDKEFATRFKSVGKRQLTGSVDEAFRVEGDPLQLDHLCIRIYITSEINMGEGDKGVFANQMKSVVGKKLTGEYRTDSGVVIDAVFGVSSIENRIVESPIIIGMASELLELHSQEAVDVYEA